MFAGYRKLDNLVVIVDLNGLQIDGAISEICDPEPLDKKFEAFRFHTITLTEMILNRSHKRHLKKQVQQRNANSDHCKDRKRKRRVLYGKCCELAWCCTKR